MATVAERLEAVGLALPLAPTPAGAYVPAVRAGDLVFTAGQLPMSGGALISSGHVPAEVSTEVAVLCARQCCLNALAAASSVCELDDVVRAVKLTGYVASSPGFTAQPSIVDGASAVLAVAFGETGAHAREAVGVLELPLGSPVEVSLILQLR